MIVKSEFIPPFWARNRHLQTIWPRFFIRKPSLSLTWERLATPDGDFIELAWNQKLPQAKGLMVIYHGLEGSVESHYAAHLMNDLFNQGWDSVLVHFRGCGPSGNQTARSYHSGETTDSLLALRHISDGMTQPKLAIIGYSLGANMLLKMLGDDYQGPHIHQAIAVSPPFDLAKCSRAISQGFSRVYENHLLKSMRQKFIVKYPQYDYPALIGVELNEIDELASFFQFDDRITGPLHGFNGAQHYYDTCSARCFTRNIQTDTLVLHAKDDPFMTEDIVPEEDMLSPQVCIELSDRGGHVGFMQGSPWNPELWINKRVIRCLNEITI